MHFVNFSEKILSSKFRLPFSDFQITQKIIYPGLISTALGGTKQYIYGTVHFLLLFSSFQKSDRSLMKVVSSIHFNFEGEEIKLVLRCLFSSYWFAYKTEFHSFLLYFLHEYYMKWMTKYYEILKDFSQKNISNHAIYVTVETRFCLKYCRRNLISVPCVRNYFSWRKKLLL